jgi:hypothetical protein
MRNEVGNLTERCDESWKILVRTQAAESHDVRRRKCRRRIRRDSRRLTVRLAPRKVRDRDFVFVDIECLMISPRENSEIVMT